MRCGPESGRGCLICAELTALFVLDCFICAAAGQTVCDETRAEARDRLEQPRVLPLCIVRPAIPPLSEKAKT